MCGHELVPEFTTSTCFCLFRIWSISSPPSSTTKSPESTSWTRTRTVFQMTSKLSKKRCGVFLESRFMSKKAVRCVTAGCCVCVQVEKSAADADRAVTGVEKTHKRATDLDSEVEKLRKKIQGEGNHRHLVAFHWFQVIFDHETESIWLRSHRFATEAEGVGHHGAQRRLGEAVQGC